jgi:hypothetical protein
VSPSTKHPEALPDIPSLRRLMKSMAMLDAIISPEWQYRYYSYNSKWSTGEEMASMRDGCGDDWFMLFGPFGAALKGFAHESPAAADRTFPARVKQAVPAGFESFLNEAAFSMDRATFCLWRRHSDATWNVVARANVENDDGSEELLRVLDGDPQSYQAWSEGYYERSVSLVAVRAIYGHEPLNVDRVAALNPEITLADIETDATEIGYEIEPVG